MKVFWAAKNPKNPLNQTRKTNHCQPLPAIATGCPEGVAMGGNPLARKDSSVKKPPGSALRFRVWEIPADGLSEAEITPLYQFLSLTSHNSICERKKK
jgi:hypothetical protein